MSKAPKLPDSETIAARWEGKIWISFAAEVGEIVTKARNLGCFSNQPVAEIVQCGEPPSTGSIPETKPSTAATAMIQTGFIFVRASTSVPTMMSTACHGVSVA